MELNAAERGAGLVRVGGACGEGFFDRQRVFGWLVLRLVCQVGLELDAVLGRVYWHLFNREDGA